MRFWVGEFDIDGIRLDAADVLDFEFMKELRRTANEVKEDFWLMGEVIHGEYSRWVNNDTLHSVTDYALHKALYSGHNDHNYFEIAHTVRRNGSILQGNAHLYNFVDNHDVERIITKLQNKAHYLPVHILLYALPGIPSIYYGSEFGIEGRKQWGSDDSLRPFIDLKEHIGDYENNECTGLIVRLGKIYAVYKELVYGDYRELYLTTGQYAFARDGVVIAVNNADQQAQLNIDMPEGEYEGLIAGQHANAQGGQAQITLDPCSGEIFVPLDDRYQEYLKLLSEEKTVWKPIRHKQRKPSKPDIESDKEEIPSVEIPDIPYEQMSIEQLQAVILAKMERNGNVTDRMRREVKENIWHDSLVNWAKSF
jgi:hypothetical protein